MLLCCLSKKGLTTTFELRNYFKEKGDLSMQLSVQGYLQQRKRLNPEIFPYLNRKYLMDFYRSDEPRLWKGYLLIAIDGSKAEVPNSKDNREAFGNSGNQHSGKGQVRALVSGMYDVLNHFYLDIEIEHICISENELAKRNLKQLKKIGIKKPVVAVFDRGYPSLEFIGLSGNGRVLWSSFFVTLVAKKIVLINLCYRPCFIWGSITIITVWTNMIIINVCKFFYLLIECFLCCKLIQICAFILQGIEITLHRCIVVRISCFAHALCHIYRFAEFGKCFGRIL